MLGKPFFVTFCEIRDSKTASKSLHQGKIVLHMHALTHTHARTFAYTRALSHTLEKRSIKWLESRRDQQRRPQEVKNEDIEKFVVSFVNQKMFRVTSCER